MTSGSQDDRPLGEDVKERDRWQPLVSVVVPVRNEEQHIEACLERLLAQDYPRERLEILVVDGRSSDRTRAIVKTVAAHHPDASVRLLDNPERTVPHAMNTGIRAARGAVIVRMDGHSIPTPDYVALSIAALERSGAANVGGVFEAKGATPFGEAVAVATENSIGAGDARYRIGGVPGNVDTVPYGAFRREVFERIGLFDESLTRNQDYELNVRIRGAGERVYFDPAIRCTYTPRGTVRSLWSQYFQYGWWKVETIRRHPGSLRWRQLVPPAFVAVVLLLAIASPWSAIAATLLAATLAVYLLTLTVVARRIAPPRATVGRVLVAFLVLHFAWSVGFLLNVVSLGRYPYRATPPRVPPLSDPNGST